MLSACDSRELPATSALPAYVSIRQHKSAYVRAEDIDVRGQPVH